MRHGEWQVTIILIAVRYGHSDDMRDWMRGGNPLCSVLLYMYSRWEHWWLVVEKSMVDGGRVDGWWRKC